ncbi:hypothetical protein [Nocardioides sp. AX2bis]|uniref:hypothetical protein n=1 Tax=Nocardioides sp. AX2bis TaxID=2653157 RepID=UPI0012EFF84D|nr:hypothetical protein [Nocardioides sp. AX2bis]VXB37309.1 conserved hypothetical protein [Nocardioides sp. AX2bis]
MATRRATAPTPLDPVGAFGPPVAAARARELRALVLAHGRAEPRRRFPAVLHVGRPGGLETARPAHDAADDHALRVEVLEAMLRRVRALPTDLPGDPVLVWLTRSGPLTLQDVDAAWGAAVRAAGAELTLDPLPLVVVTRTGWWEPATGSGRRWRRLRGHP